MTEDKSYERTPRPSLRQKGGRVTLNSRGVEIDRDSGQRASDNSRASRTGYRSQSRITVSASDSGASYSSRRSSSSRSSQAESSRHEATTRSSGGRILVDSRGNVVNRDRSSESDGERTRSRSGESSRNSSGRSSRSSAADQDTRKSRPSARGNAGSRSSRSSSSRSGASRGYAAALGGSGGRGRFNRGDVYVGAANQPRINPLLIGGIIVIIALIILAIVLFTQCSRADDTKVEDAVVVEPTVVSFAAVGDNLPDEYIGYFADRKAGEEGDGDYDYRPIYEPIKSYIQDADLAYINQETHIGGDDLGPQGYPSFNTTSQMADAVVDTGFDFVASATNHSYDWGLYDAIPFSLSVWEKKPVAFTGTAVTEEQYNRIATQEREGITFALLNYTYGVNGFEKEELPEYAVNFIDEDRIKSDVARAKEQADVVMVAMHWGTENLTEADDTQKRLAQLLADLDVDVVLGSHPHVIGPMAWVSNSNGSGHKTLVAYSLGNFLADHETPNQINVLEGMLTCDFVKTDDDSAISIENVKWVPLVCHSNEARDDFAIYAVSDYPEDVAKQNRVFTDTEDPIGWLNDATAQIVDSEFFTTES